MKKRLTRLAAVSTLAFIGLATSVVTTGCNLDKTEQTTGQGPPPEITITDTIYDGWRGIVKGDRLVIESGGNKLKVIDLIANQELKKITLPAPDSGYDIYGDYLVWSDLRNESKTINELGSMDRANADIFLLNLKTGEEKQLTKDPSSQISPKIWQNYVVWMDNRADDVKDYPSEWKIHLYNIDNGEEKVISTAPGVHTNPAIDDGKVVWEDGRNVSKKGLRAGENVPENNTDIYLYDIQTGKEVPIATGPKKEGRPQIAGNVVVWEDYNSNSFASDIAAYDLDKNERIQITKDKFVQATPVICGDYIAWMDERRGISTNDVIVDGKKPNSDIFLYNLKTKEEKLMTGDEPQILPGISEKWLIYETSRQVKPELHVVRYR